MSDKKWPVGGGLDGIVHIWGQCREHDPSYIVGNRKGLLELRDAIDEALINGKATSDAFVNDGEGFRIIVLHVSGDILKKLSVPYTDEIARQQVVEVGDIYPWHIGGKP